MDSILQLSGGVGRGQDNNEDDVYATDNALREIGAYQPPPEYASEPQRYTSEPMVNALESFPEQNGLKIDGYAKPGGPTEQAINNRLTGKPRGAAPSCTISTSRSETRSATASRTSRAMCKP